MLRRLYLKDFLLVQESDIAFKPGITVLTGETGAGKSILINALSLVLGARGSASWIRKPKIRAEIRAEFDISLHKNIQHKLGELQIEHEQELVLRRILQDSGKSKSYVNDVPVTLATVKKIGGMLVDIYGQHSHQALIKPDFQRISLDSFANLKTPLAQFATDYQIWQALVFKQQKLIAKDNTQADRIELLEYQQHELAQLALGQNEFETLEFEQKQLSLAESAAENLGKIYTELDSADISLISTLQIISQQLSDLKETYPDLRNADELLSTSVVQIEEAAADIRSLNEKIEVNPERLLQVDNRLDEILSMARKYHGQPNDLHEIHQGLTKELEAMQNQGLELEKINLQIKQREEKLKQQAGKITDKRKKAALTLASMVTKKIRTLGMQGATFKIHILGLIDSKINQHGQDRISYEIETNLEQGFSPIGVSASGGELSRLGLAIQVCTTQETSLPVMVFDEVDAGIGGETADTVGNLLHQLSQQAQVLCVTHLTQIARIADQHFKVSKDLVARQVFNQVEELTPKTRVAEIARMLGGNKISETTIEHAKELLARNDNLPASARKISPS